MRKYARNPFEPMTSVNISGWQSARFDVTNDISSNSVQPQNQSLRRPILKKRLFIITIVCFAGIFVMLGRLYALQHNPDKYRGMADSNRIRILSQQAPRGIIYDRYGVALTKNSPDVAVVVTTKDLPDEQLELNRIIERVADITQTQKESVSQAIQDLSVTPSIEPRVLLPHITHDQAIRLSIESSTLPGIHVSPRIFREYIYGQPFAHVLGYTGKINDTEWQTLQSTTGYTLSDDVGKTGVEQTYETDLKGKNGREEVEVNAFGQVARVIASEAPIDGKDITLTIDKELQEQAFAALQKAAQSANSKGAALVALDPHSGEVLALISWPSFDNNLFSKSISSQDYQSLITDPTKPLFVRPISGEYPSGSTIKPVIASAALQEGVITPRTTVISTGGIRINQWFFPDWKAGGHGVTDVRKAIAESVNTFFYAVGGGYGDIQGLGVENIKKYGELFGLNQQQHIDLPGEADGFLPTESWKQETKGEPWYIGDTYHLAIGQGDLLVTPLQLANAIATISNGGTLYQPHVVKRVGDVLVDPIILQSGFINSANLAVVREGMRQTITSGSAKSLGSLPISVAGKTGTAQYGNEGKNHAWFTCYAPYENPQIVLAIILEGGGEGSTTAVPVAKDILTWWAQNRFEPK